MEERKLLVRPSGWISTSVMAAIMFAMFISPTELWYNTNPRSGDFTKIFDKRGVDHRGAAEFVLAQSLTSADLVIAVDAQQQSYYLGDRLDYYLRSLNSVRNSSFVRDESMLNLYTGTPQISSGEEFATLFSAHRRGRIFVIGSGEIIKNPLRYLGDGIWETMQEFGVQEVYRGRDHATTVWRFTGASTGNQGAVQ